ncbi:hypothetical protein L915_04566, partial [Phytophthora nicotianae]
AMNNYGLVMDIGQGSTVELLFNTDTDFANDPIGRKIIRGYASMIDGNVILYASRKQERSMRKSSLERSIAMSEGQKCLQWLRKLYDELQWE